MKLLRSITKRLGGGRGSFQNQAFGVARRWSNAELRRFAGMFPGAAVNVSAWEDRDKEGGRYKDYFTAADSYHITNFGTDQGVLQNTPNEIFLDLEADLDASLHERFATVFNHTTLEHVWDFRKALANMCAMSSDIVVIVVPWLQPQHTDYGDYWRFSPSAMVRLFDEQGFSVRHLAWNDDKAASVYVLAIATRNPERWASRFPNSPSSSSSEDFLKLPDNFPGRNVFG